MSNPIPISVLANINIGLLKDEILCYLENFVEASFSVKISDESMSLVSELFDQAHVQNIEYTDGQVEVVFRAIPWFAEKINKRIKKLGGEFNLKEKSGGETDGVAESCCFEMGP